MTPRFYKKANPAAGNMLLIVLVGIALFAALMFTLSRGNRGDVGTEENAALQAQQITSYADKVNGAVQNIMLQNHCLASQIGFTAGASGACQIFDQSGLGGGMIVQSPPAAAVDNASFAAAGSPAATKAGTYLYEGNICVTGAGSSCSAGGSSLVLILPWVTQTVCAQINWITMKSTSIPTVTTAAFDGTKFTGTYAGTFTLTMPVGYTTFQSGCFQSTSTPSGGYHFYEVLQAN